MMYCVVPGCCSQVGATRGVVFHEFPSNMERRESWTLAVRALKPPIHDSDDPWVPSEYAKICSKHFKPDDYIQGPKKRYLAPHAMPSKFQQTCDVQTRGRRGRPRKPRLADDSSSAAIVSEPLSMGESSKRPQAGITTTPVVIRHLLGYSSRLRRDHQGTVGTVSTQVTSAVPSERGNARLSAGTMEPSENADAGVTHSAITLAGSCSQQTRVVVPLRGSHSAAPSVGCQTQVTGLTIAAYEEQIQSLRDECKRLRDELYELRRVGVDTICNGGVTTAMAGQRNSSSSNGSSNQQQQQQTVDRESGETEAKIPKTSCEENSQNGAPTPQVAEDGDAESLGASKQQSLQEEDGKEEGGEEESAVPLVVMYNKRRYDVKVALSAKMAKLKEEIQKLTGVPPAMQKLIYKGAPKPDDNKSLVELNLSANAKLMLVGSTLDDVLNLEVPTPEQLKDDTPQATKEPISKQKLHQKVVDKGVPEDAIPGIRNVKDSLPAAPLSGMLNKSGGKVRLTFKLELDQVWIGTKERTEKINMSSIKQVISEAIEGHEEYHIMALQLGTTEASRYWIYWVPAQYVDAIKETILGK
ncbi:uncharacterized protein LOC142590121 isoform X1 [Dermacentor variabilis]|uniref:uncharacterized protein LOC142590121 isoform X1 n=2 Tax=Dermacentor variabilis TaxID=34621 RepID=UPI003F5C09E0